LVEFWPLVVFFVRSVFESFKSLLLLSVGRLGSLALLSRNLAALLSWDGLATLPGDGFALLLRIVEAMLLWHVVALLVPDNVARLRWHVLALLPLHLSRDDATLLGGDISADRAGACGALLLGNRFASLARDGLALLLAHVCALESGDLLAILPWDASWHSLALGCWDAPALFPWLPATPLLLHICANLSWDVPALFVLHTLALLHGHCLAVFPRNLSWHIVALLCGDVAALLPWN